MAAIMAAIMEITENIMRRMHEPSTKLHNALYFMSGMMVVILALVIVAGVKTKAENAGFHIADDTENSYEQQVAGQTDTTQDSGQEKWQEGVVAYQGKEYLYNTDIKTYLMMGVDIDISILFSFLPSRPKEGHDTSFREGSNEADPATGSVLEQLRKHLLKAESDPLPDAVPGSIFFWIPRCQRLRGSASHRLQPPVPSRSDSQTPPPAIH